MCYSAQIWAEYKKYAKMYGARLDIAAYAQLFWARLQDSRIKIPKAMEMEFLSPHSEAEQEIKTAIEQHHQQEALRLEQELFSQRKRLADAQRSLQNRSTKAATESLRIASSKIDSALSKLSTLASTQRLEGDNRIYPGYYAPVMVMEQGERVIKPMRYQCRPAGKPAAYDRQYPGTYNARRDNLQGFWKAQFGHTHAVVVANAFYEHVTLQDNGKGPASKRILEFKPRPVQDMLVACLWSRWTGAGAPDLYSFAAITDEPPPEVAAAGHDRCIIPIRPENVDAWLQPGLRQAQQLYAILDDRERPYYEHRLVA